MIRYLVAAAALGVAVLVGCGGSGTDPVACADLKGLTLSGATIATATPVPAGTFTTPGAGPFAPATALADMPAFCRVVGTATTSSDSGIGFELWIPTASWNAKYMQVGTQGYAGAYQWVPMSVALKRGYAVASTDTGHPFDVPDLTDWAVGHPQKVIDFGYRAHKVTRDLAVAIVATNMGAAPKFSYFYGGSNGGRETMMHAQRYPDDFDGYVSEGPAINWSRLSAAWLNTQQALYADPANTIPPAKLPAIQSAALAQCDAIDGVTDGVVDDPRACHFDAAVLLCTGAESNSCLTAPQVAALQRVMDGPRNPRTGARVYAGFEPGGVNSPSWVQFIIGPAIPGFLDTGFNMWLGNAYFSNLAGGAGNAVTYAFRSLNFDTDVTAAQNHVVTGTETLASVIDAGSTDLSGIKRRNAKIIMSTGWDDPVVPARSIIDYYESVVNGPAFGQSLTTTQSNFRLFLVPGENHLTGGAGATAYGSPFGQPSTAKDAQHDMIAALEAWVEQGTAPDSVIAARYNNDDPAAGVARTRPICAYPKVAHYKGTGSNTDAANFSCIDAPRGGYPN